MCPQYSELPSNLSTIDQPNYDFILNKIITMNLSIKTKIGNPM